MNPSVSAIPAPSAVKQRLWTAKSVGFLPRQKSTRLSWTSTAGRDTFQRRCERRDRVFVDLPTNAHRRRDVSDRNASVDLVTPTPQSPVRRAAAGNGAAGRLIMNLGTSIVIKGDLIASEDLTLYGKMEGSCHARRRPYPHHRPLRRHQGHDRRQGGRHPGRGDRQRHGPREGRDPDRPARCLATSALPASRSPTARPSAARFTSTRRLAIQLSADALPA